LNNKKSYGYCLNINEDDKEDLRHILIFSDFKVDFTFYIRNWEWIKKQMKESGYVKEYEKKYDTETEVIYSLNSDKKLYYYI
jgi:hypothetical protein